MHYRLPVAIAILCIHAVIGSEDVAETDSESTHDDSLHRVRRGLSMLRLGRGLQMLRLGKRALPMLRLGRSAPDSLSNDDFQYILSLMRNDRQVPLPRYGKDLALQYMLMNALKNPESGSEIYDDAGSDYGYGYALDSSPERQIRPAPRPGRYRRSIDDVSNTDIDQDKSDSTRVVPVPRFGKGIDDRVAPLMRYGKESLYDEDVDENVVKRAMRMLRLGRGMRMLRLGKRPADSETDGLSEVDKRALRLLRLGKRRPFAMLRLGRSDNEEEKRALRLLRLGKKSDSDEV